MQSTYLDTRRRPNPFLEISTKTKDYIGVQLMDQGDDSDLRKFNAVKFDSIVTFWTTLAKVSDVIENGKRLENISWRLVNRKLLLKNELSMNDVSTVVEVAKGIECKELRHSLHKRKSNHDGNLEINGNNKRISATKINGNSLSSDRSSCSSTQIPSLFSKRQVVVSSSSNSNVTLNTSNTSPIKDQNNSKDTNRSRNQNHARKTNFFFNNSSPDSSSLSPPPRVQSSEQITDNIKRVLRESGHGSTSNLNLKSNNTNNMVSSLFGVKHDVHQIHGTTKPASSTQSNYAQKLLQSHTHSHHQGHGHGNAHPHAHSHVHTHVVHSQNQHGTQTTSIGKHPHHLVSNLNPQKRDGQERNTTQSQPQPQPPATLFKSNANQTQRPILTKHQSHNTVLNTNAPSLFKPVQSQTKTIPKNTSQTSITSNNSKTSLFNFKPKPKQKHGDDTVAFLNNGNNTSNVENARKFVNDEDDDDDDDDDVVDVSYGLYSLSDDDDDDDDDHDDDDNLNFKKQNIVPVEVKARPVLKRSLLSGLFLDELDKPETVKEDRKIVPKKRASQYDSQHKSNAPLTAQTLLPTALTTHIFLPTKNFTTVQNRQRHQYNGEKTHQVPGLKSPPLPPQTHGNLLQLTKDNIAKFTKDEVPRNRSYAGSIHTTTSSIDIPGWELKKMREKRRDERKIEKETEGDKLPVHLIDSLQNENKFLFESDTNTGFVDDKIMSKKKLHNLDDDDFNYHAKGW